MSNLVYTLINKETPLCDFVIEGEGELELCKIVKEYNPLPFWCANIVLGLPTEVLLNTEVM